MSAQAEPPRIDVVAAILLDSLTTPTQLLAGRRTEPPLLAGGWEIPGGKVDPGESSEQALHREIAEEIGVQIVIGPQVPGPLAGWWPLGLRYRMLVNLAEICAGTPEPLEDHSELRWLAPPALWSVDWLPANRPIITAAAALLWP
ncbi:MAG: (deoxy)nucleoside triphosphate pyrophosphohydrolase [Tetrasphaera sp.]